jgi:hypothetical protein
MVKHYTLEMADFGTKGNSKRVALRHVHVVGRGKTRAERRAYALTQARIICQRDGFTFSPVLGYVTPKREITGQVVSPSGAVLLRGKIKPLPFRAANRES